MLLYSKIKVRSQKPTRELDQIARTPANDTAREGRLGDILHLIPVDIGNHPSLIVMGTVAGGLFVGVKYFCLHPGPGTWWRDVVAMCFLKVVLLLRFIISHLAGVYMKGRIQIQCYKTGV